jgi:lantibiotic biosynthesis protein
VCSLSGDIGLDLRWRLALAGMDLLFDDLGLGLPEKREVARRAREGFSREFRVGGNFRARVSKRFRAERDRLEEMLTAQAGLHEIDVASTSPLAGGLVTLRRRSRRSAPVMAQLRQLAESGELAVPLADLAHSFAHMHVNRSLRSAQRAQELVLYELLDRIYSSQAGRQASRR